MNLYPAIDLKNKRCVRLIQGKFDQETIYDNNPLSVAEKWINQGTRWLHIIDLDGAQGLGDNNLDIVLSMNKLPVKLQVGGGLRTLDKITPLLESGIERVILSTVALENLDLLKQMIKKYPGRIVISIDAKDGIVYSHGWQKESNVDAITLAKELKTIGIKTIIYTDIAKDGMLVGPNTTVYEKLKKETQLEIIAAGGISRLDDLKTLKAIGLDGAIIGKALYENRINLKEAFTCLQDVSSPV